MMVFFFLFQTMEGVGIFHFACDPYRCLNIENANQLPGGEDYWLYSLDGYVTLQLGPLQHCIVMLCDSVADNHCVSRQECILHPRDYDNDDQTRKGFLITNPYSQFTVLIAPGTSLADLPPYLTIEEYYIEEKDVWSFLTQEEEEEKEEEEVLSDQMMKCMRLW
jgi:hypothetical protein